MTAKERAEKMVERFLTSRAEDDTNDVRDVHAAVRCAKVAVDEMTDNAAFVSAVLRDRYREFWLDVRQEIDNISTSEKHGPKTAMQRMYAFLKDGGYDYDTLSFVVDMIELERQQLIDAYEDFGYETGLDYYNQNFN